jgi:hypothetical protein
MRPDGWPRPRSPRPDRIRSGALSSLPHLHDHAPAPLRSAHGQRPTTAAVRRALFVAREVRVTPSFLSHNMHRRPNLVSRCTWAHASRSYRMRERLYCIYPVLLAQEEVIVSILYCSAPSSGPVWADWQPTTSGGTGVNEVVQLLARSLQLLHLRGGVTSRRTCG